MLTWLFIQESSFSSAFTHLKSLDSKTKGNGSSIYELANICNENNDYETTIQCFNYIIKKGLTSPYYLDSKIGLIRVMKKKILEENEYEIGDLIQLEIHFNSILKEFGKNRKTVLLMKDLAHLYAFYLDKVNQAIDLLQEALQVASSANELSECRLELADILVFSGDRSEAILHYAKIEKISKDNQIAHEAKFRKAKVYYYQGDFAFAKAQVDVLKASTTKFIANDAMRLSLLISDNTALDTTMDALFIFAQAELLSFQNKDDLAIKKLDSILSIFSEHTIVDDAIFKKAEIMVKQKKYAKAIEFFKKVESNYSFGILADDACFYLAEIFYKKNNNNDLAKNYYEKILTHYKSSIFVPQARKIFRKLRGDEIN